MSSSARRRPGRRWLVAGGVLGLAALAPSAAKAAGSARALVLRARRELEDPVSAFCEAPCYEHDRAQDPGSQAQQETVT